MNWENPGALLFLWLVPVIVALRTFADRARDRGREALLGARMQARLSPQPSEFRRWSKHALVALGLAAALCALARPRWGIYYEDVEAHGVDIYVLIDTSRSMLATDVLPNRLGCAKSDVRDFLHKIKGDRVGLIAFAGAAVVKCPLTLDARFFDLALEELDVNSAPRGGTHIGDAVRVALRSFGTESTGRTRLILLVTDGDDQESYPLDAAAQAAEQGVQIIAVGLGDPDDGSLVPSADGGFMTYKGEHVRSKLDESALLRMTEVTGGVLVPAGTRQHDLGKIYDEKIADMLGEEATGTKRSRLHERFQWFAALALAALLADFLLSAYRAAEPGDPLVLVKE